MAKTFSQKERDKIKKIYITINRLALGGRNFALDYRILVDEIIEKKDYSYLGQVLLIYYDIDIRSYRNINEVKELTWNEICFKTSTPLQQKLKTLHKANNVFQNGFDFYSDDPKYLVMTYSGPLSSTYSVLATQSQISFTYSNDIYINIQNPNVYNVKFQRINWINRDGVRSPLDLYDHHTIASGTYSYLTQSTYKTTIPIDHGSDYLVTTTARDPYEKQIYSFNLSKENYIGKIEEVDVWMDSPEPYYQYVTLTYSQPLSSTYSVIATQSQVGFSYDVENNLTVYLDNPYGASGSTEPYVYELEFNLVKWKNGVPTNLNYNRKINSSTQSYLTSPAYIIELPVNPFSDTGTQFIITSKAKNVGKTASINQFYSLDFQTNNYEQVQDSPFYFYRSPEVATKLGYKRTFLKATKNGSITSQLFFSINTLISEELNLYNRYVNAINYLTN